MSLVTASSLGKCLRFLSALSSCICKLFNGIGRVDDFSHLRGEIVKNDLFPVAAPAFGFELRQPPGGGFGRLGR